uniref:Uncharacterized protein n=1 Tax=Anguilla anguilla TaxID=7936 RepID=A0A0E9QCG2_ANGAN
MFVSVTFTEPENSCVPANQLRSPSYSNNYSKKLRICLIAC